MLRFPAGKLRIPEAVAQTQDLRVVTLEREGDREPRRTLTDWKTMKLKDSRVFYYTASGTASQIGRQLTLAGIAILWLLANGLQGGRIALTNRLLAVGWALVAYLVLDLLQYLYKTAAWAIWTRSKEKGLNRSNAQAGCEDTEVGEAPDPINIPTWALFILKMALLLAGFAILLWDIQSRIS
jgi:hypothetical protein